MIRRGHAKKIPWVGTFWWLCELWDYIRKLAKRHDLRCYVITYPCGHSGVWRFTVLQSTCVVVHVVSFASGRCGRILLYHLCQNKRTISIPSDDWPPEGVYDYGFTSLLKYSKIIIILCWHRLVDAKCPKLCQPRRTSACYLNVTYSLSYWTTWAVGRGFKKQYYFFRT